MARKKTKSVKSAVAVYDSMPKSAHPVLVNFFGYCLGKTMMKLKEEMMREYEKLNLYPPQAGLLAILSASGPLNQLSIGDELGIDKASMVKLIDGVEAMGLVQRKVDSKDRRAKTVEITAKGRKILPRLKAARERVEANHLSALNPSEAETYRNLTRKIFLARFAKPKVEQ